MRLPQRKRCPGPRRGCRDARLPQNMRRRRARAARGRCRRTPDDPVRQARQECLFVGEVPVERGGADAELGRQFAHGEVRQAALVEERHGRSQDLLARDAAPVGRAPC